MNQNILSIDKSETRKPVLDLVDRVSEMLFGLFMALSFVGAISVMSSGNEEIHTLVVAALGCNLAWGITDALMYLVTTLSGRGNLLKLVHNVRGARDAASGCRMISDYLPHGLSVVITPADVEAIRARLVALPEVPSRPALRVDDVLGAAGVFLIVVASTFPVVLPYVLISDVATAIYLSRIIALVMLFLGGAAIGRYSNYSIWLSGFGMMGLGIVVVMAIRALGG